MYDFDLHISKVVFPRFFKIICRREWQCFSVPNYSSINVLWSQKSRNNSNPATCWAVLWTSDTFKKLPVFRRKKKRRKKNSIQHKISFKNCPITNICKTRRVSQFILGLTWMRMSVCVRTAWQVVSPHQQNLATLPAPPPTPRSAPVPPGSDHWAERWRKSTRVHSGLNGALTKLGLKS